MSDVRKNDSNAFRTLLYVLAGVDNIIRQTRRNHTLSSILRSIKGLRVAVTSDKIPWLDIDEDVDFVGTRTWAEAMEYMAGAKTVINCSPTYPTNFHERIRNAMSFGAVAITDENLHLKQAYGSDLYVAYGLESTMTLSEVFEEYDLEKIAHAGFNRIHSDHSLSWDFHLDKILGLAAGS
jgi:hypothetical protein